MRNLIFVLLMGVLGLWGEVSGWSAGINFRATSDWVVDSTGFTYSLGEPFPITRGGLTFGWTLPPSFVYDLLRWYNDGYVQTHFTGVNQCDNYHDTSSIFALILPNSGTYVLKLALGDWTDGINKQITYIIDGSRVIDSVIYFGSTVTVPMGLNGDTSFIFNNLSSKSYSFTTDTLKIKIGSLGMHNVEQRSSISALYIKDTLLSKVPASITVQPQSQTINLGQSVTFTGSASGSGTISYQWRKNGTNISGATNSNYTFTPIYSDSGALYSLSAISDTGSAAISNGALLTIHNVVSKTVAVCTVNPQPVVVNAGQSATFTSTFTGTGNFTYQWQVSTNGTTYSNVSGATNNSYSLTAILADSGKKFRIIGIGDTIGDTSSAALLSVHTVVATGGTNKPNWPLEVITWDLTKAHPSVPYDFRLGVIGGEYPYSYELVTFPTGMTIDSINGSILWNTPSTPSATNSVSVVVTDRLGQTLTHTWNIEVTTAGFYFVNSSSGNDLNLGTISQPFKTFDKAYKEKANGDIIYLRAGTYHTDSGGVSSGTHYPKMIVLRNTTPQIWIGYPGETVNFDGQYTGTIPEGISSWEFVLASPSGTNKFLFQNINFVNSGYHTFAMYQMDNIILRNNIFNGYTASGAENPSFIHTIALGEDIPNLTREKIVIQNNEFKNLNVPAGAVMVLYDTKKVLCEDNYLHDIIGNGLQDKQNGYYNTYRNNVIHDITNGLVMMAQVGMVNIDIGYNLVYNTSEKNMYIGYQPGYVKDFFVHHNTFDNETVIRYNLATYPQSNNYNIYNNIIVNNDVGLSLENSAVLDSARTKLKADSNLYYCNFEGAQAVTFLNFGTYPRLTLAQWRTFGFDSNSIFANPNLDTSFHLSSTSPYYGIYGRDGAPIINTARAKAVALCTVQPQQQTVNAGQTATFSSTFTGSGTLTYQWQVSTNGTTYTNVPGANSSTLSFTTTLADSGKRYRNICAGDTLGDTSNAALLTVHFIVAGPTISGILPTNVRRGRIITISGSNLSSSGTLMIGGISCGPPASWTNTQIVDTVPLTAPRGIDTVRVTTNSGSASFPIRVLVPFLIFSKWGQ